MRKPEFPGLHQELCNNQHTFGFRHGEGVELWVAEFRKRLLALLPAAIDSEERRMQWVQQPHPKKPLRVRWDVDRRDRGLMEDNRIGTELFGVDIVGKPGEALADGKKIRVIGNLREDAAAVLGYYMDDVKSAFAEEFVYKGCMAKFIKKPSEGTLMEVFLGLMAPEHRLVMYYFSDDSCVGIRCSDGVFYCNMDVSACDGSNYDFVFDTLERAMTVESIHAKDVARCFAQLNERGIVRSTQSSRKAVMVPVSKVLYSGSVLTTSVNNMAEILMFISMADRLGTCTIEDAPGFIEGAAANAGYLVKVQECRFGEDIQFLKHSPVRGIDGEWHPVLNAGVLLRNFGRSWGDLPGRACHSFVERARAYNSDVVKSYVHAGNTAVFRAFRTRFIVSETHEGHRGMRYLEATGRYLGSERVRLGGCEVDEESFRRRYDISAQQLEEFLHVVRVLEVGTAYSSSVVDAFMRADYGYEPVCVDTVLPHG